MTGREWWPKLKAIHAVLLLTGIGLMGCQASGLDEGLLAAAPIPGAVAGSTYGDGPVLVTMLLPEAAEMRTMARDIADGAKLALDDLGAGQIRIDFQTTGSAASQAVTQVQAAVAAGTKLVIGPATHPEVLNIVSGVSEPRPPILALVAGPLADGEQIWPLYPNVIDSAIEGARVPIAPGQKRIVVLHESGLQAAQLQRLREGVEKIGGTVLGFLAYPASGKSLSAAFAQEPRVLAEANAIILLAKGEVGGDLVDILASGKFVQPVISVVSAYDISDVIDLRRSSRGLMVGKPPAADFGLIAGRFRAKYNRQFSYDAAIGYDSIAIPAGLIRKGGSDAITADNLTSRQGFHAATGLFRFLPEGKIERRMTAYRIENGNLAVIQDEGVGF